MQVNGPRACGAYWHTRAATEAPNAVYSVLRAARAVQRRRPRIAAGSALVAAGSVARLRAASA